MHELSITESLLELCEEYAQGKIIEEIHIKIGRLSGVETSLLKRSFETFKENQPFSFTLIYMKGIHCGGLKTNKKNRR